jgi:hypothetical protein
MDTYGVEGFVTSQKNSSVSTTLARKSNISKKSKLTISCRSLGVEIRHENLTVQGSPAT